MKADRTEENFERVFKLLDVISIEVGLSRNEIAESRKETAVGFDRVERRLGKIESRLESLEDARA